LETGEPGVDAETDITTTKEGRVTDRSALWRAPGNWCIIVRGASHRLIHEKGTEAAGDGGEGFLGGHDVIDFFVSDGGFFTEVAFEAGVVPDAFELLAEAARGDFVAGLGAGEGAAGAVGAGIQRVGVAFAQRVEGAGAHGAGDDPGGVEGGEGGAFAVDEAVAGDVAFEGEVVVVAVVEGWEIGGEMENVFDGVGGAEGEEAAVFFGPGAGDLDIVEVSAAFGGGGVEGEDAGGEAAGAREVVVVDALAEMARAGVEHEPEVAGGFVGLEFE